MLACLQLNQHLSTKTFLVGTHAPTVADLVIFAVTLPATTTLPIAQHHQLANLLRWADTVQGNIGEHTVLQAPQGAQGPSKPAAAANQGSTPAPPAQGGAPAKASKEAPQGAPSPAAPLAPNGTAAGSKKEKGGGEGGKKEGGGAPAEGGGKAKKEGGGGKKEEEEARIDVLDIRVGQITKVLCASTEAHDKVVPVSPPEDARVGERITVAGYDQAPIEEVNPKKKILERLFPDMRTNADGIPCYKGVPFSTSAGHVTSPVPEAHVA
ncbi:nucleic acid-binding protein [Dunaliella salina]|uniref:Nucleic acid-binding protein n=1 Tax=Dunaliella salina TaxID=3046 RepID=A0ABQ7H5N8_DUNSA|nr:nucleic acid-binding protein [Dunaliella salina]|eukprot:KAF5842170.1 nucleic acid-binding protein [Dunaliella salina]